MSQITDLSLYYQYKILLDKLFLIGFSKIAISWYESYLEERYFTVEAANRVSKFANISCGVPQGSILGPLLWYEPSSGMRLVLICRWFMLAVSALECHWNKKKQLTKDFSNICDWFVYIELCIQFGEDKTKSILFSSERKKLSKN